MTIRICGDDGMNYLPLSQVCKINMGQSPESSSYNENGDGLPFFQGNADFGERHPVTRVWCNAPTKIAHAGDILISVRAPIGAMNYASEECCIGRGLAAITPDANEVSSEFIFWLLKGKNTELNSKGTGSTFKAIGRRVLEEVLVPDIGLKQQAEYAQVLETVYNLIEGRKEQLRTLDQLIKARFVEMFGEPHRSKMYPYLKVSELTDVVSGGTPDRKNADYWNEGTIPWVKTTELQNNVITVVEERITEKGLSDSSAKKVPANTVLIAMYGQGKTRGMTGFLGIEACTNQACACLLPTNNIGMQYLWYFLILSYDELRGLAQGGNQPNLNAGMIKDFPILIPPMEEQRKFVSFVSQVDKSKLSIQASLDQLETLKQSLMQKYFG